MSWKKVFMLILSLNSKLPNLPSEYYSTDSLLLTSPNAILP